LFRKYIAGLYSTQYGRAWGIVTLYDRDGTSVGLCNRFNDGYSVNKNYLKRTKIIKTNKLGFIGNFEKLINI